MAAGRQFGHARQDDSQGDAGDDAGRISGSRPAQGQYEPLPLGSEAFLPPLPPAVEDEPSRTRELLPWIMLGSSVLAASAAFAVVMAGEMPRAELEAGRHPHTPIVVVPSVETPVAAPAPSGAEAEATAALERDAPSQRADEAAPSPSVAEQEAQASAPVEPRARETHHHHHPQAKLPQHLERAQVIAALGQVRPAVLACFGATRGTADVKITVIGSSGRVTTAQVISGQGGPIGSCIAREVRRARFPQFADASLVISYPFAR